MNSPKTATSSKYFCYNVEEIFFIVRDGNTESEKEAADEKA